MSAYGTVRVAARSGPGWPGPPSYPRSSECPQTTERQVATSHEAGVGCLVTADDRSEGVERAAVQECLALGPAEWPVIGTQERFAQFGPIGPAPEVEPDEVANATVDPGVLEVDEIQSPVLVDPVPRLEVQVAGNPFKVLDAGQRRHVFSRQSL